MEEENKVSIWLGKFESEDKLNKFMEEQFTEDGDMYSDFMRAFKIDFIDNQFQEVYFSANLSKDSLKPFSSSESYINDINADFSKYNSIIALYNFNYPGNVSSADGVDFVGVYDYE